MRSWLSRGARKAAGGPDSTIRPSSMNTMRSATSIAKCISWVTTSIVMPAAASDRITSRIPATSSGSSEDVASSNSISLGIERQRPSDGDALLLTARQARRVLVGLVGESDIGQPGTSPRVGRRPAQPSRAPQAERHVLDRGQVREHVEVLEHHADVGTQADQPLALSAPEPRQPAMLLRRVVLVAVEDDRSRRRRGDEIDAAQQRALARAARSDDAHDLAPLDVEVDAVEHLDRAERLGDRAESEERIGHHRPMVVCEQSLVRLGV